MNVLSRHWLISVWMLLCSSFLQGQQLTFLNPLKNTLIPSQECYNIMQDSKGYIWFSTEAGLCRYDGTRLRVFDRSHGLNDEAVYAMDEDPNGVIWLTTSDNRIMYYKDGVLREAPFLKNYQKYITQEGDSYPFFLDASARDQIYISHRFFTLRINTRTNKIEQLECDRKGANFAFARFSAQRYVPFRLNYASTGSKKIRLQLCEGRNGFHEIVTTNRVDNLLSWYVVSASAGNTHFVTVQNVLLKIEHNRVVGTYDLPERILSLHVDSQGGLWAGTYKNGLFYYPDTRTMKLGHHSLPTYSISGITEDHERGLWCTTLERGLFYTKNKGLITYPDFEGLNRRLTVLKYEEGLLIASSGGNELLVKDKENFRRVPLPYPREFEIADVMKHDQGWLIGSSFFFLFANENLTGIRSAADIPKGAGRDELGSHCLTKLKDGTTFSCIFQAVYRLGEKGWETVFRRRDMCRCLLEGNAPGTLLIGGSKGLLSLDLKTKKATTITGVAGNVVKLLRDHTGRIWVITKGDGVYWIDGNVVTRAGSKMRLTTRFFFDIAEDIHGTIWLASNSGLIRVKKQSEKYEVRNYSTRNGLLSNEVYKVATDSNFLYFSTFEGLGSFPLHLDLKNTAQPKIHLHSLLVNDKKLEYKTPLKLQFHERRLRFVFDVLTYKNSPEPTLFYTLEFNGEPSSKKVAGTELLFENMVQGSYKLTVYGINNDRVMSAKPLVFYFEVEHPFWQKWWFIAFEVLLLFLIIYLTVRLIARRIRKREEGKTELNRLMAEYQMTALQAQMNPHFIFNAINTIQGYILNKNEQEAYNYLAKFSRLIRMVLHHSQERMHSLDQELEVLNLYIELEQLRFDHRFDYKLEVMTEIDPHDCFLPGMLLQPYVENAIWHGLINLETRRGLLLVKIVQEGDTLVITIEDNGVGREVAIGFRKDRLHQSTAMKLNEQRLMVLNKLDGFEQARVTVTDLCDPDDQPIGTRVNVIIPIN